MIRIALTRLFCAALTTVFCNFFAVAAEKKVTSTKLHVPSPDWRDQIIYFVLTDRFADGDPRNNDQGAGEYAPGVLSRYQGGDLIGLRGHLDYVQGLGATAVWLTPPVLNVWRSPAIDYTGYHGYWATHFKQLDPHLGTLADYQALSHDLHSRGMYLVQDIVLNHTGDFFYYGPQWSEKNPAQAYRPNADLRPSAAPTQPPFNLNDPRRAVDRAAGIYHWTPDIRDLADRSQELNFQLSGLDDLNTESPRVRRALRDSYGYWIDTVGVDAFRVDTAFYVPPELFEDFLFSNDRRAPGILKRARVTGRNDFFVFGEGFGIDRAGEEAQMRRIEDYVTRPDGGPRMAGMLNFPLYGSLSDVLSRGRPALELGQRIERMMSLHRDPHRMPSFVDNHDVDRWLASGSIPGLRQALFALFTLPGIPVIYYGTEQGFRAQRAPMFTPGVPEGPTHFKRDAPLYRDIASLSALRKAHRSLRRGQPTIIRAEAAGPGALAWRMTEGDASLLMVLNTAEHEILLDRLATGLPPGTRLEPAHGLDQPPAPAMVDTQGELTLRLPPRAAFAWRAGGHGAIAVLPQPTLIDDSAPVRVAAPFDLTGVAPAGAALQLVVDGNLSLAQRVVADSAGRWAARIDTGAMIDPAVVHRVVAWDGRNTPSRAHEFRVAPNWQTVAAIDDPAADDTGPSGQYRYPTDPSFRPGQLDLRNVSVETSGGAMRVSLVMGEISQVWKPANDFDHVAFTLFIELPDTAPGAAVMPRQNALLPDGMTWHRRLRAHGWSNALFSSEGATAEHDGTPITPGAQITADPATRTLRFTLPAAALGNPPSLRGARIYVTTWDYDGGYRALSPSGGAFVFGGGTASEPKILDHAVITLP